MALLNSRTIDGGGRVDTHFNKGITEYGHEVAMQRAIAKGEGYVDSSAPYYIGVKDVYEVKQILDSNSKSWSSDGLAKEILLSTNHREYLAEWFKGRGDFTTHFSNVLKMLEVVIHDIDKLEGYTLTQYGKAWEIKRS